MASSRTISQTAISLADRMTFAKQSETQTLLKEFDNLETKDRIDCRIAMCVKQLPDVTYIFEIVRLFEEGVITVEEIERQLSFLSTNLKNITNPDPFIVAGLCYHNKMQCRESTLPGSEYVDDDGKPISITSITKGIVVESDKEGTIKYPAPKYTHILKKCPNKECVKGHSFQKMCLQYSLSGRCNVDQRNTKRSRSVKCDVTGRCQHSHVCVVCLLTKSQRCDHVPANFQAYFQEYTSKLEKLTLLTRVVMSPGSVCLDILKVKETLAAQGVTIFDVPLYLDEDDNIEENRAYFQLVRASSHNLNPKFFEVYDLTIDLRKYFTLEEISQIPHYQEIYNNESVFPHSIVPSKMTTIDLFSDYTTRRCSTVLALENFTCGVKVRPFGATLSIEDCERYGYATEGYYGTTIRSPKLMTAVSSTISEVVKTITAMEEYISWKTWPSKLRVEKSVE